MSAAALLPAGLRGTRGTSAAEPHAPAAPAAEAPAPTAAGAVSQQLLALVMRHVPALGMARDSLRSASHASARQRRMGSAVSRQRSQLGYAPAHAHVGPARMPAEHTPFASQASISPRGSVQLAATPVPDFLDLPSAVLQQLHELSSHSTEQFVAAVRHTAWLYSHLIADVQSLAHVATGDAANARALLATIYQHSLPCGMRVHDVYARVQRAAAAMYDAQRQVSSWRALHSEAAGALLRHLSTCGRLLGQRADTLVREAQRWVGAATDEARTLLDSCCAVVLSFEAARAGHAWGPGAILCSALITLQSKAGDHPRFVVCSCRLRSMHGICSCSAEQLPTDDSVTTCCMMPCKGPALVDLVIVV